MPRALPSRRMPYRRPVQRRRGDPSVPLRTSDLILALLGFVLLGSFALMTAATLAAS